MTRRNDYDQGEPRRPFGRSGDRNEPSHPRMGRRGKIFIGVAVSTLVGVAVFLYLRSDAFALKRVEVEGNAVVTDAEIESLLPMGENLFSLDTDELAERISRHPYLAETEIEEVYPDELVVRVSERTPACYLAEGTLQLLSGNGTVMPDPGTADGTVFDLPVVTGYEVKRMGELETYEDGMVLAACELCAEMQRQSLPLFDELVEIRPHADHLEGLLADGSRILLPPECTPSTLAALQAVYTRESQSGFTELDARYERQIISRHRTG